MTLWPNWIGRETTNLEIGGSSPSRVGKHLSSVGLVGYDDCLTRSRSPVRSRDRVLFLGLPRPGGGSRPHRGAAINKPRSRGAVGSAPVL